MRSENRVEGGEKGKIRRKEKEELTEEVREWRLGKYNVTAMTHSSEF